MKKIADFNRYIFFTLFLAFLISCDSNITSNNVSNEDEDLHFEEITLILSDI